MLKFTKLGLILILVFLFGFFVTDSTTQEDVNQKPFVLSTIGMIHDVVDYVLPSEIDRKLLLPSGTDPHVYVPGLDDISKINQADLIFALGLNLEAQMRPALESVSHTKPTVFVGELINTESLIKHDNEIDPHIWFDLDLFSLVVEQIAEALSKQYPKHSNLISANALDYLDALTELDLYAQEKLSSIADSQRWLITTHDAFSYFGRKYNFNILTLKGVNTSSDYSLHDKKLMESVIIENQLKSIFVEDTVSNRDLMSVLDSVQRMGQNTQLGGYLFADSLGSDSSGYNTFIKMFKYNVDTIFNSLN